MEGEAKRFRIYTRAGDCGSSSLYTGQRLAKDNAYFQALGDVDELNSCLGIAREFTAEEPLATQLATVQSRLIDVGSALATPANTGQAKRVQHTRFGDQHTTTLESWIDEMDESLPPLKFFILPSGGRAAVFLHQARSVCRRAERTVVALTRSTAAVAAEGSAVRAGKAESVQGEQTHEGAPHSIGAATATNGASDDATVAGDVVDLDADDVVDGDVRVYLNRLSDYLFTAARYMAYKEGRQEQTYQKAQAQ